ncbi:MAG: deoxyribodipyrimidine photo-lyase [Phycisphaerales bacterium]|nr:deoxyribodipyrimidine photo-lyase [Phycisphaerales bacterium]
MSDTPPTIVWYRQDLRIDDHQALFHAADRGRVVPVYIHDPDPHASRANGSSKPRPMGAASKWWLHHSLQALADSLDDLGSPLVMRSGDPAKVLRELCEQTGADQVAVNKAIDPVTDDWDDEIEDELESSDIELIRFAPDLLWTIGTVMTGDDSPYKVFTPFWKAAIQHQVVDPLDAPKKLKPPTTSPDSDDLESFNLIDPIGWDDGFMDRWTPGESSARKRFKSFRKNLIDSYHDTRNQLDEPGWSAMSPHLHFGEISPRRMWNILHTKHDLNNEKGPAAYARQLVWREFSCHLLNHFPETPSQPFREQFKDFPWASNPEHLKRWQRGQTGYPIVDAAMRQLWTQGWMPNRVRMVVASFLCKHLLISWTDPRWLEEQLHRLERHLPVRIGWVHRFD